MNSSMMNHFRGRILSVLNSVYHWRSWRIIHNRLLPWCARGWVLYWSLRERRWRIDGCWWIRAVAADTLIIWIHLRINEWNYKNRIVRKKVSILVSRQLRRSHWIEPVAKIVEVENSRQSRYTRHFFNQMKWYDKKWNAYSLKCFSNQCIVR